MRAEGRRVLLHCVAAQQRSPTVAVAYGVHMGQARTEAAVQVRAALLSTRGHAYLHRIRQ